jgi:CHAD domain-containing protein
MKDITVGEAITAAIRDLVGQFDETERAALAGEPDGVHRHRTTVRRLRNVLRVFRDLFDESAVAKTRAGLREWGTALGVVRDHEVVIEFAAALLREVSPRSPEARIPARLVKPEREAAVAAQRRIVEIHDLERLRQARIRLHAFADDPPLLPAADAPASAVRQTLVRAAQRVLRRAQCSTRSRQSPHTLRKRARRLRHAVEAMTAEPPGLFGRRMRRIAKAAHRLQTDLGDQRDALLLVTRIERARVLARRAGEEVLVYDQLAEAAQTLADDRERALPEAVDTLAAIVAAAAR